MGHPEELPQDLHAVADVCGGGQPFYPPPVPARHPAPVGCRPLLFAARRLAAQELDRQRKVHVGRQDALRQPRRLLLQPWQPGLPYDVFDSMQDNCMQALPC
eukprot:5243985-Pleurochrysis_carterae.AAC.1